MGLGKTALPTKKGVIPYLRSRILPTQGIIDLLDQTVVISVQ